MVSRMVEVKIIAAISIRESNFYDTHMPLNHRHELRGYDIFFFTSLKEEQPE